MAACPTDEALKGELQKCKAEADGGAQDPMFGPAGMAKLMANPKTAAYFADPAFVQKFQMMKSNPQMMMQFMQGDPRFMDVF